MKWWLALGVILSGNAANASVTIKQALNQATNPQQFSGKPTLPLLVFQTVSPAATDALPAGMVASIADPRVGGVMVLLPWSTEEPTAGNYTFSASSALSQIAANLDYTGANHQGVPQKIVIGVYGNGVAPTWLQSAPYGVNGTGVPYAAFQVNLAGACITLNLGATWDGYSNLSSTTSYIARYEAVTAALIAALKSQNFSGSTTKLWANTIGIKNGAMNLRNTGEMGVFSVGCAGTGTQQTAAQVAAAWAALPPPDNYTGQAVITAFNALTANLESQVAGSLEACCSGC